MDQKRNDSENIGFEKFPRDFKDEKTFEGRDGSWIQIKQSISCNFPPELNWDCKKEDCKKNDKKDDCKKDDKKDDCKMDEREDKKDDCKKEEKKGCECCCGCFEEKDHCDYPRKSENDYCEKKDFSYKDENEMYFDKKENSGRCCCNRCNQCRRGCFFRIF